MTSTRQKTLNRLSSIFLPSNNNNTNSDVSDGPVLPSSNSKSSPPKNKVRKSTVSLPHKMNTSTSWPLPAPDAEESSVSHSGVQVHAPQITASPDEGLSKLDFGLPGSEFLGQDNTALNLQPQQPQTAAIAATLSVLPPVAQSNDTLLSANPNSKNVIANGYGNHSTTDLSKKQKHATLLMKRQKSETVLRKDFPANAPSAHAASHNKQPGRTSTISSLPSLLHPQTMSLRSSKPPLTQPKRNKSWLFGGSSSSKREVRELSPPAWVTGTDERVPYDLNNLTSGNKVPELWNDAGNVVVHLFPRSSRFGPQFRLNAEHIASSSYLASLAHGSSRSSRSSRQSSVSHSHGPVSFDPRTQRVIANVPGGSSYGNSPNASHTDSSDDSRERDARIAESDAKDVHLYLPLNLTNPTTPSLSDADVGRLVLVRNLFAFLVGQSLLATRQYPTTFAVFVQVANLLLEYGFSNMDSSTFGEVANASFTCYAEELGLLDVRKSPKKAVEGLILGERMRSAVLWNEAFTHAVGRYSDIQAMSVPLMSSVSPIAKQRVERAHMNLEKRMLRIQNQISDFDFPSIFGGIINSRTAKEREIAGFEQWKSGFQNARRFFLNHLKTKHKSWPPKRPRDAGPSVPALHRSALQGLYQDATVLYDLMVDRKHPSSRLMIFGRNFPPHIDRRIEALRKVLQEFDQSGSPTYPVMPFDAPRVPRIASGDDDATSEFPDRVPKNELAALLKGSYNKDAHDEKHPFAAQWMSFEYRSTSGMTIDKVANFRLGSWLFLYCVLQALPMVTVDAPGVSFKEGVLYFLCEPSRGRLHWSKEGQQWELYRDPVTGVVAKLAKDTVDLSDEAIYKLSHCWQQGAKWEHELTNMPGKTPSATQRKASQALSTAQLPTPPSSERRFSGASSHGQQSVHQAPQHMSLQSLYMAQHDNFAHSSSPQAPSSQHGSPQLLAADYRSASPVLLQSQPPYNTSPEMAASPDPVGLGLEHPPIMPGIQEELPIVNPQSRSSSRGHSPHSVYGGLGRRGNRESIFMSGLERLPVPAVSSPMSREQRSARTASMTFDEILGPITGQTSNPNSPKLHSERKQSRSRQAMRQSTR